MISRGRCNVSEVIIEQCHGGKKSIRTRQLLGVDHTLPKMPGNHADFDSDISFLHDVTMPPGASIGLHTHIGSEEFYYVLEGKGLMTIDGEYIEMEPGDVVLVKNGESHEFKNVGKNDLHMMVVEARVDLNKKV